jgi:hypothetical protein
MFLNGNCSSLVTNWRFYDSVYTERYAEPQMQTVTMTTTNKPCEQIERVLFDTRLRR